LAGVIALLALAAQHGFDATPDARPQAADAGPAAAPMVPAGMAAIPVHPAVPSVPVVIQAAPPAQAPDESRGPPIGTRRSAQGAGTK
jgi:hypothetical protein